MRRILMILVLVLAVAPFALADEAPTADLTLEATAADVNLNEEVSLEEIFAETEGTHGAQSRYVCPDAANGECTDDRDCEFFCPANAPAKTCNNPLGKACTGSCYCC